MSGVPQVHFDPSTGLVGSPDVAMPSAPVYDAGQDQIVGVDPSTIPARAAAQAAPGAPAPLSGRMVNVIDPSGRPGQMPEENLEQAKALGYEVETDYQRGIRQAVEGDRGTLGGLKQGAKSFGNELLLGLPGLIYDKTADPYEVAKAEAIKKDHDVASAIGSTLGFGASMFLPGLGEIGAAGKATKAAVLGGEAVEHALAARIATQIAADGTSKAVANAAAPSLARRILASAAGTGVEGALISAPRAVTEAALGDPNEAAESLVYGLGVGAALGGVGALGSEFLGAATSKLKGGNATIGEAIDKFGERQGYLSLNPTKKFADEIARLPGGEEAAQEVVAKYGIRKKVGQGSESLAEQVNAAREKVGKEIGSTARRFDELAGKPSVNAQNIADTIAKDVLGPLSSGTGAVGKESTAERVRSWGDSFFRNTVEKGESFPFRVKKDITFEELQKIRTDLNAKIKGLGGFSANAEEKEAANAFKDVRKIVDDAYFSRAEEIANAKGEGQLVDRLKELRKDYSFLKPLSKAAENNIGRFTANRTAGLSEHLTAQVGERVGNAVGAAVGSLGGGALGSLVGAPLGGAVGGAIKREGHSVFAAASEKLGLLFAEQAMKRTAEQLDRIPGILSGELKSKASSVGRQESNAMLSLIGEKGAGLSKQAQFTKVYDKLTTYASNPDRMAADIADLTGKLAEGGAPQIAQSVALKMQSAMEYLQTQLPKPTTQPSPLTRGKWRASDAQIADFERKVAVAMHPFSVVERVADSTLTKGEVDTMRTLYPRMYDTMIDRVNRYAFDPEKAKPMKYAQRAKLSMLTEHDFDVGISPQAVRASQEIYQRKPDERPSGVQLKVPDVSTESQRISNK